MSKISPSDTIGILGIVFFVVTLVLDKAGLLKGTLLQICLIVAGAMTLFIAVGNSWVMDAPTKWRIWRGSLATCVVIFLYTGLSIAVQEQEAKSSTNVTPAPLVPKQSIPAPTPVLDATPASQTKLPPTETNSLSTPSLKPALITMIETKASRNTERRRTQIDLTLKNVGETETIGSIKSILLVDGEPFQTDTAPPKQISFIPNQPIGINLWVTNRSQEGFDAIWNGSNAVEARVQIQFNVSASRKRTYIWRGNLLPDTESISTLQSDYIDGAPKKTIAFPGKPDEYIKTYGLVGDSRSVFAEVDTAGLSDFAEDYVMVVAALLGEPEKSAFSKESMSDELLQAGRPFGISGRRVRSEIQVSDTFKTKINSLTKISIRFYICLLPHSAKDKKITKLDDIGKIGGHVIGDRRIDSGHHIEMK